MTTQLLLNPAHPHEYTVNLPGSKSISNRVLLLSALAKGQTRIQGLLDSDDTHYMKEALKTLGVFLVQDENDLLVEGVAGRFPVLSASLFLGNAGTAFRPLTAALSMMSGDYELSGVPRMHERPIGDLVNALTCIGAHIDYLQETGYPPLHIHPLNGLSTHETSVKGDVSSQFLTALLMALPLSHTPFVIHVDGELISKPYIDITLNLMARFGVQVRHNQHQFFHIPKVTSYVSPETIKVEGDASSASYFLAAGLISATPVKVVGVGSSSIQGDIAFAHVLSNLGATVIWSDDAIEVSRAKDVQICPFDVDANAIPDAAMTLCIVALSAQGTSHIRNIGSWRVKETDRISAMKTELEKLGAHVSMTNDAISITPPVKLNNGARIHTYDDHRMAMCFSLVSLLGVSVVIEDPACVNKTYPEYFKAFQEMIA